MSALIDESTVDQPTEVRALLNYTRNSGVRPVNYTFDPPAGVPRNSGEVDARTVTIRNARGFRGLTLDVSGFETIWHRSTLTDWASFQDSERVKTLDYPEVEAALKSHTGADKVVIFDHTLRDSTIELGGAVPNRPWHVESTHRDRPARRPNHSDRDRQRMQHAPARTAAGTNKSCNNNGLGRQFGTRRPPQETPSAQIRLSARGWTTSPSVDCRMPGNPTSNFV